MDDAQLQDQRRRLEHNSRHAFGAGDRERYKRLLAPVHAEIDRREKRASDNLASELDSDSDDSSSGADYNDDNDDGDSSDGAYSDGDEEDSDDSGGDDGSSDAPMADDNTAADAAADDASSDGESSDCEDEFVTLDRARLTGLSATALIVVVEERTHAWKAIDAIIESLRATVPIRDLPSDVLLHSVDVAMRLTNAKEEAARRVAAARAEAATIVATSKRRRVRG